MERQQREFKSDLFKMIWYMRGAVTYTESLQLSQQERRMINQLIQENLETTKKSGLPFF